MIYKRLTINFLDILRIHSKLANYMVKYSQRGVTISAKGTCTILFMTAYFFSRAIILANFNSYLRTSDLRLYSPTSKMPGDDKKQFQLEGYSVLLFFHESHIFFPTIHIPTRRNKVSMAYDIKEFSWLEIAGAVPGRGIT